LLDRLIGGDHAELLAEIDRHTNAAVISLGSARQERDGDGSRDPVFAPVAFYIAITASTSRTSARSSHGDRPAGPREVRAKLRPITASP
jgi:hypothetical protein